MSLELNWDTVSFLSLAKTLASWIHCGKVIILFNGKTASERSGIQQFMQLVHAAAWSQKAEKLPARDWELQKTVTITVLEVPELEWSRKQGNYKELMTVSQTLKGRQKIKKMYLSP